MALDMITAVEKAETQAEQIIRDAQTAARQILKDATDRSYRIGTEQEEKTEREVARTIAAGEDSAREERDEVARNSEREVSAMRQLVSGRMEDAVRRIVERIGE